MGFLPFFLAFDHTKTFSTYPREKKRKKKATHDAHQKKIHKEEYQKVELTKNSLLDDGIEMGKRQFRCSSFVWLFEVHIYVAFLFSLSSSAKTNIMFHHQKVAT